MLKWIDVLIVKCERLPIEAPQQPTWSAMLRTGSIPLQQLVPADAKLERVTLIVSQTSEQGKTAPIVDLKPWRKSDDRTLSVLMPLNKIGALFST